MQVLCYAFFCTHLENTILSVELSTGRIVERDQLVVLDLDVELDREVVLVRDVELDVDPCLDVSAVDVSANDVSANDVLAADVSSDVSSYNLK
jgi:hypothetical protein